MTRTIRTLLLSVTAPGAMATAAAAAPPTTAAGPAVADGGSAGMHAAASMVGMHATPSMPRMPAGTADMAGMHSTMIADPAVHESMLADPVMQAHMAGYGIDADQIRRWHDQTGWDDDIHAALAEQGVDMDAMPADCPMLTGGSMEPMHRGGGDHTGHHDIPGR